MAALDRNGTSALNPGIFNYKPDVGPNKGKHFRISLDKHLQRRIEGRTEAEREARNLRTAIDEGRFGVPVPPATR